MQPNALRFCCRGVRRSRASQSRIYLARLRRANAPVSSKRGLGGSLENRRARRHEVTGDHFDEQAALKGADGLRRSPSGWAPPEPEEDLDREKSSTARIRGGGIRSEWAKLPGANGPLSRVEKESIRDRHLSDAVDVTSTVDPYRNGCMPGHRRTCEGRRIENRGVAFQPG